MKWTLFAALLVVFVTEVAAASKKPGPTQVKCSAFTAIRIRQIGSGSCHGSAKARCAAIARAQDDFKEAYDTWFSDSEPCAQKTIKAAARACATAVASVYTEAMARVKCKLHGKSKGFACGYSISQGSAFAAAVAKAVAQGAVDVASVDGDGFCYADVASESAAMAEAASKAQAEACVEGTGSKDDFSSAMVESVADALAEAFVKATASTCSTEGESSAAAECHGKTLADVRDTVKKQQEGEKAQASGRAVEVFECKDAMIRECCPTSFTALFCNCDDCGGRWYRRFDYGGEKARTWKKGRKTCRCPTPTVVAV